MAKMDQHDMDISQEPLDMMEISQEPGITPISQDAELPIPKLERSHRPKITRVLSVTAEEPPTKFTRTEIVIEPLSITPSVLTREMSVEPSVLKREMSVEPYDIEPPPLRRSTTTFP
jgi:hypothetical protein